MRICFVCLGNICRSPTAHGVMQHLVREHGLAHAITIESAGTAAEHDEPTDPRTIAAARRRGFALGSRARRFTSADLDRYDLVIAMDANNLRDLRRLAGTRAAPEIVLLRRFDPAAPADAEVPDPWYGGAAGFEEVLDQCERACAGLLAHISERVRARGTAGDPV